MIIDKLENILKYNIISENMYKKAMSDLSLGRHELSDTVYMNVEEYETKTDNKFEIHKKYADIQIILEGTERLDYGYMQNCAYDESRDIAFFDTKTVSSVVLDGSNFVIFFPDEAHRPQMCVDAPNKVKKAVIKIRV